MDISPLEHLSRQKVRMAIRLLRDAVRGYEQLGQVYGRPALNAEILDPIAEELAARLEEAERLMPYTR